MHIPDSMLQGNICPVTAIMSVTGLIVATSIGCKAEHKPVPAYFGAVTALIFAGQMMNFPITNGTSGHILGGVLAASMLGTPFGILAMALVVCIQSILFSDGGLAVLGANIFNMAILGTGVGGMLRSRLLVNGQGSLHNYVVTAFAALCSVVLASLAVSAELALDGKILFLPVARAMVETHFLIGIGEALVTVAAYILLAEMKVYGNVTPRSAVVKFTAATVVFVLLAPFASRLPDGLEWIAAKYHFLHQSAPVFVGFLSDYIVPAIHNETLSTHVAGLAGVLASFCLAWLVSRMIDIAAVKS